MAKTMETDETKIAVLVEKVGNMNTTLIKVGDKLDTMTDKFATKDEVAALARKVTSLENWRIWVVGAATSAAVLASFLKDWFLGGHR